MTTGDDLIRRYNENRKRIMETKEPLSREDAAWIIEEVLDTLIEVGNGVTDEHLHDACDLLFKFRDQWFKNAEKKDG